MGRPRSHHSHVNANLTGTCLPEDIGDSYHGLCAAVHISPIHRRQSTVACIPRSKVRTTGGWPTASPLLRTHNPSLTPRYAPPQPTPMHARSDHAHAPWLTPRSAAQREHLDAARATQQTRLHRLLRVSHPHPRRRSPVRSWPAPPLRMLLRGGMPRPMSVNASTAVLPCPRVVTASSHRAPSSGLGVASAKGATNCHVQFRARPPKWQFELLRMRPAVFCSPYGRGRGGWLGTACLAVLIV